MSSAALKAGSTNRARHKKTKSGVPVEELPVLQGWIARESGVVDKLLNKRYAALYSNTLVTYRKDTDPSPSKVFPLASDTTLTPVAGDEYKLRHKHTSTLWAVAGGAYDTMQMWGFTIDWSHSSYGGSEKLTLAFEKEETAEEWHAAIQRAISHLDRPSLQRTSSKGSLASSLDYQEVSLRCVDEAPSQQAMGQRGGGRGGGDGARRERETAEEEGVRKGRAWASVLHMNGVAVYTEEVDESGEGGAVMVSAVVRSRPADVFRHLVQVRKREGLGVFVGARTVETLDMQNHIVAQTWRASGLTGGVTAPREMVLLRTWRKDQDGTYIVLYQSTKHRAVREDSSGWGWFKPVRVQVQAAGFTIAPLMPQFCGGGESQEALLTMVLKSDAGGFLSERSLVRRVLGPLSRSAMRGILEPVVTSIVMLRDKVEQDRFVVRPLSAMAVGEDVEEQAAVVGEEAAEQRRAAFKKRTATMLTYRGSPLLKAQQEKAEKASVERAAAAREALASPPRPSAAQQGELEEEAAGPPPPSEEDTAAAVAAAQHEAEAILGTCDPKYWSCPGAAAFKVRGPNYLADKKKVESPPPLFELVATDLLELEEPLYNICQHLPAVRDSPAPFLLCVQLMVPSTPPISLVTHFAAPFKLDGVPPEDIIARVEAEQDGPAQPALAATIRNMAEFLEGDGPEADKRRNTRFKLIPNIVKGSWIIKQSVGTTPVILGQKLTTKYFRGANYFEIDVDIGSSSVAASVTNLVCGATKSLTIDLGVLLEGQTPETLPEQLLGTIRLDRLDLGTAAYYDEVSRKIIAREDLRKNM